MGVDCNINLPGNVRVNDVADLIGIAAGLPARKHDLDYKGAWTVRVDGVKVENACVVGLVDINLSGKMIDGQKDHTVFYHFEDDGSSGRCLLPRSTAFWIAVGRKLIDFFGGALVYQDCDGNEDYVKPANPDNINCPQDGEDWQNFQQRMLDVQPITKEELLECDEFAAYKLSELEE